MAECGGSGSGGRPNGGDDDNKSKENTVRDAEANKEMIKCHTCRQSKTCGVGDIEDTWCPANKKLKEANKKLKEAEENVNDNKEMGAAAGGDVYNDEENVDNNEEMAADVETDKGKKSEDDEKSAPK